MTSGRSGTAPAPGVWRGAWMLVDATSPTEVPTSFAGALRGVTAVGGLEAGELLPVLAGIPDDVDVVVLADGATVTETGLAQARSLAGDLAAGCDAVVAVRPVTDALKRVAAEPCGPPRSVAAVARDALVHPTWPQVVRPGPLRAGIVAGTAIADLAGWLVDAGYRVRLRPVTATVQECS